MGVACGDRSYQTCQSCICDWVKRIDWASNTDVGNKRTPGVRLSVVNSRHSRISKRSCTIESGLRSLAEGCTTASFAAGSASNLVLGADANVNPPAIATADIMALINL